MASTETTKFQLDPNGPLDLAEPKQAAVLAPFLFSDRERHTVGAQYLLAVASFGEISELDPLLEGAEFEAEREKAKLLIGKSLVTLLAICCVTRQDEEGLIKPDKWQHRGPDCTNLTAVALQRVLVAKACAIASRTRDCLLLPTVQERLNPMQQRIRAAVDKATADAQKDQTRAELAISKAALEVIKSTEDAVDLWQLAGFWKLSLRECFGAWADTRRCNMLKYSAKYCR